MNKSFPPSRCGSQFSTTFFLKTLFELPQLWTLDSVQGQLRLETQCPKWGKEGKRARRQGQGRCSKDCWPKNNAKPSWFHQVRTSYIKLINPGIVPREKDIWRASTGWKNKAVLPLAGTTAISSRNKAIGTTISEMTVTCTCSSHALLWGIAITALDLFFSL